MFLSAQSIRWILLGIAFSSSGCELLIGFSPDRVQKASAQNNDGAQTSSMGTVKIEKIDTALATIRQLSASSQCNGCHQSANHPFNSDNRDTAISILNKVAVGTEPKKSLLYIRALRGETHASYTQITLNAVGWENAIIELQTALNLPSNGGSSSSGDTLATVIKLNCGQALRRLSQRLTGETISPGDSRWDSFMSLCRADRLEEIARSLTGDSGFSTNTLTQFVAPMQWPTQRVRDMPMLSLAGSTMIGIVRDDRPVREFLTGDYFYHVDQSWGSVPTERDSFIMRKTNNTVNVNQDRSFAAIERRSNLGDGSMLYYTKQRIRNFQPYRYSAGGDSSDIHRRPFPDGQTPNDLNYQGYQQDLPDNDHDAGILTMEGFVNNYTAGTNRRAVQSLVNQFWCLPLDAIRNSNVSENWIGRDVSRNPLGANSRASFEGNCKTCHGVMDGLRGAFYHFTTGDNGYIFGVSNNIATLGLKGSYGNRAANPRAKYDDKYFRNLDVAPEGYVNQGNEWQANFSPAFMAKVEWPQNRLTGKGIHDLSRAFVETRQYYACMVKKATDIVCPSVRGFEFADDRVDFEGPLGKDAHNELVTELRRDQNLKRIFEKIAVHPNCLGEVSREQ